jgi:acetyl esterase
LLQPVYITVADERLAVFGGPPLCGPVEINGARVHRVAFDGIEQTRVTCEVAPEARRRGEECVRRDDQSRRAPPQRREIVERLNVLRAVGEIQQQHVFSANRAFGAWNEDEAAIRGVRSPRRQVELMVVQRDRERVESLRCGAVDERSCRKRDLVNRIVLGMRVELHLEHRVIHYRAMTAMRPDAATAQFLQVLNSAGQPTLEEQGVAAARAGTRANNQRIARPPLALHRVEDRRIPTRDSVVGVRIYWPRPLDVSERLPIVVYFHGGGFTLCDLDTHDPIARHLSRHADAIVVSVDYRLAPEHKFPAALDDSYAAVTWAAEHAAELGGDALRLAVAGDSAGGNLAAVVCQLARERGGPAIAFQALIYPVVDLDMTAPFASRKEFGGGEYFLAIREMEWFNSLYLTDPAAQVKDPRVSPLKSDDVRRLPPALVITAGCDPLRDEGQAYAERLDAAGVPVEYRCFEQTIHAFLNFAPLIPAGDEALAFLAERLHAALHAAAQAG